MDINFGSRYQDKKGNVYKLVGKAVGMDKKQPDILLFAPVHAGTVGNLVYVNAADADFTPVSKFY